jgi:hypothetical protein
MAVKEEKGPIREASLEFATWISRCQVLEDDDVDAHIDKTIISLIDYYDIISDAAMRGIIDEEMIIRHLGGAMRSTHKVVEKYIEARRVTLERPGLYEQFIKFVTERIKDRRV